MFGVALSNPAVTASPPRGWPARPAGRSPPARRAGRAGDGARSSGCPPRLWPGGPAARCPLRDARCGTAQAAAPGLARPARATARPSCWASLQRQPVRPDPPVQGVGCVAREHVPGTADRRPQAVTDAEAVVAAAGPRQLGQRAALVDLEHAARLAVATPIGRAHV